MNSPHDQAQGKERPEDRDSPARRAGTNWDRNVFSSRVRKTNVRIKRQPARKLGDAGRRGCPGKPGKRQDEEGRHRPEVEQPHQGIQERVASSVRNDSPGPRSRSKNTSLTSTPATKIPEGQHRLAGAGQVLSAAGPAHPQPEQREHRQPARREQIAGCGSARGAGTGTPSRRRG